MAVDWEITYRRAIAWAELEAEEAECVRAVRADPSRAFLLVSEPRPTFTAGRSAKGSDLLWDSERLAARGAEARTAGRGGQWTFHGPGQVVVYPIVALPALGLPKRGVVAFLDRFREGVREFVAAHGVATEAPEMTAETPFGVYHQGRKLAAFGISLHAGICANGVALYLKPQDAWFTGIHPCGVPGARLVSLAELGVSLPWEQAASELAASLKKCFQGSRT